MSRSAGIAFALMMITASGAAQATDVTGRLAMLRSLALGDGHRQASIERQTERVDSAHGYATHMVRLINEYRQRNGLAPLQLSDDLLRIASAHSQRMATQRRISHDGFERRADRTGASICVENVGWNFPHAESQLHGWRASDSHHRNLLEPRVRYAGVAMSDSYVTFFACS